MVCFDLLCFPFPCFRLASLEAGQRDASDFIRWQEEMKQREAAEKLADIERKHLVYKNDNYMHLSLET